MLAERNAWRRSMLLSYHDSLGPMRYAGSIEIKSLENVFPGAERLSHTRIMRIIDFQAQVFSLLYDSLCILAPRKQFSQLPREE